MKYTYLSKERAPSLAASGLFVFGRRLDLRGSPASFLFLIFVFLWLQLLLEVRHFLFERAHLVLQRPALLLVPDSLFLLHFCVFVRSGQLCSQLHPLSHSARTSLPHFLSFRSPARGHSLVPPSFLVYRLSLAGALPAPSPLF